MNKKAKILSIVTVLALVLSLAAVIPAGFAGAQAVGALPAGALVDRVGVGWALVAAHALLVAAAVVAGLGWLYSTVLLGR
ncbi:MAG: hypothetical protein IH823_09050 [Candidatus Dadabacteria bacterium]|nr:hypothetical protein [Candidatus Dadabacteria bacterium]